MKPTEIRTLYSIYKNTAGVFTDTRKPLQNGLFFALSGPNFNANSFAHKALSLGAKAAVVDDKVLAQENENFFWVENSLQSLQDLARFHRKQLSTTIVGLTGSNGKTTTKELMSSVLQTHFKTVATKGNLNNHIGVPLSLLAIDPETEIAVIEMGANHQGEIATLCDIASPDLGYITNFGKAHLEGFGGIEGIIKGKTELYRFLEKNKGTILCNADDPTQLEHTQNLQSKCYTFGCNETVDFSIKYDTSKTLTVHTENGVIQSELYGNYNLTNIGAAAALGNYFKIPFKKIQTGIATYKATQNRSETRKLGTNMVILDAYNANPTSMKHALNSFFDQFLTNRVLILGDMLELGAYSAVEHQNIVNLIQQQVDCQSFLVGKVFAKTKFETTQIHSFETIQLLGNWLKENEFHNKNILIKGSRGLALEDVLAYLEV